MKPIDVTEKIGKYLYRLHRWQCVRSSAVKSFQIADEEIKFEINSANELDCVYSYGETEMIEDLTKDIRSSDVIWDIGAHIGLFTCSISKFVPDGQVVGFEPNSDNLRSLSRNATINDEKNVLLYPCALGEKCGNASLGLHPDDESMHKVVRPSGDESFAETEKTQMTTGDAVLQKLDWAPNLVKIDVEGYEENVIAGMENVLSDSSCRIVICEVHELYDVTQEAIRERLQEYGFFVDQRYAREGVTTVKFTK